MSEIIFPDPRNHSFAEWVLFGDYYYSARDIVGFGGALTVKNLRNAYDKGIFPWHIEGLPLPWYCPEKRAILEFDELHVPRSLRKSRGRPGFSYTVDKEFRTVMENCARAPRSDGHGTWITDEFLRAYSQLHAVGDAHSVEVWDEAGEMIGGLYGVDAGGVFVGESMFYKRPNASKLALLYLIDHLKDRGATWIDIQVMTPHFKALGAKEIPRNEFLDKLEETQKKGLKLF